MVLCVCAKGMLFTAEQWLMDVFKALFFFFSFNKDILIEKLFYSLQLEPAEAAIAGRGFQNKESLLGTGMKLEGVKYFVLQADDERIIGKKGSNGFFIYKTGQGD